MYYLSTEKSKVKIAVTGDYVACYSESPRGRYFKSIKKNTISSVEYKVEKAKSKQHKSLVEFFIGIVMFLIIVVLFRFAYEFAATVSTTVRAQMYAPPPAPPKW